MEINRIGKTIKSHSSLGSNLLKVEKKASKKTILKNNCNRANKANSTKLIHCLISSIGFVDERLMPSM